MIRNYLKIAWRNVYKNWGYSLIKVLGLSVGIACCVLIVLFVSSELSFDKFHANADKLYRVWQDEKYEDQQFVSTITPLIMGPTLQSNIPEIENMCRVVNIDPIVTYNNQDFNEQVLVVDPSFFEMFNFELKNQLAAKPFANKSSIILSEEIAKKYFGSTDAIGKNLELLLGDKKTLFTVSGITENPPEASSIQYGMLISYENVNDLFSERAQMSWYNVFGETYVLLKQDATIESVTSKFPAMMKVALGEDYTEGGFEVYLQSITDIHLNKDLPQGIQPISDPKYSYILASVALLILILACANFIILAIANASGRAREVGVRKVMGAAKYQLIGQFMGEAILVTLISILLGLGLAFLFLNQFNSIVLKDLAITMNLPFLGFTLLLGVIISLIAGFYPAVILSKYKPVKVLKGKISAKGDSGIFKNGLIIGQFVITVCMLICTLIIEQQLNFFQTKDLGYNKDQKIVVPTNLSRMEGNELAQTFKTELMNNPAVANASISLYSMAEPLWVGLGITNEADEYKSFQYNAIDFEFIETMGISLKEGRSFNKQITSDIGNAAIVNETFVREFGLEDPIGKVLPGNFDQQIIGVVKDFNFQSLHTPVSPLLLTIKPDSIFRKTENINVSFPPEPRITVNFISGTPKSNVELLRSVWMKVAPNQDFEFLFLDESINSQYMAEVRTSKIVKISSALSIFIACMGLFGLVTLIVAKRKKEIGIRKVLGAKVSNIVGLVSWDFTKLIGLAILISVPLAWWFMNDWLSDFEYRIDIQWWVFVMAGLMALLIALLTISIQAVRAAMVNPTKSLRTE